MTKLSINVNKIALLRNSRGRNYPDVAAFATRCLQLGAHGITLHPRPDQRHARYDDVPQLKEICDAYKRELNIEGYPSSDFLKVVKQARPAQCTLVPDDPAQLTSDHGWDVAKEAQRLGSIINELHDKDIRVSLFVDYNSPYIPLAKELGADRIELYTEPYAHSFDTDANQAILTRFHNTAMQANEVGLGVNAGHDLSLLNLARFIQIPNILEVSIGHAFVVECLESGIEKVMHQYLEILSAS